MESVKDWWKWSVKRSNMRLGIFVEDLEWEKFHLRGDWTPEKRTLCELSSKPEVMTWCERECGVGSEGASVGCARLGSYNALGNKPLERVRDTVLLVRVQMNSLATSSSFWTPQVCFQTLGVWKKPFISVYDMLCCRTFVYRGTFLWTTGESEHLKLRVWLVFIEYLGH